MKVRHDEPWMSADEYGRSLRGLTVNLLVRDVEPALSLRARGPGGRADLFGHRLRGAPSWRVGVDAPRRPYLSRPPALRKPRGRRRARHRGRDTAARCGPRRGRGGGAAPRGPDSGGRHGQAARGTRGVHSRPGRIPVGSRPAASPIRPSSFSTSLNPNYDVAVGLRCHPPPAGASSGREAAAVRPSDTERPDGQGHAGVGGRQG